MNTSIFIVAIFIALVLAQDEPQIPVFDGVIEPRVIELGGCDRPFIPVNLKAGDTFVWKYEGRRGPKKCGYTIKAEEGSDITLDCNVFSMEDGQAMKITAPNKSKEYKGKNTPKDETIGEKCSVFMKRTQKSDGTKLECTFKAVQRNTEYSYGQESSYIDETTTPATTKEPITTKAPETTKAPTTQPSTNTCTKCGLVKPGVRIVGGKEAPKNGYPYQVGLVVYGRVVGCGATLISDRWILTAAHCTLGPYQFKVLLGGHGHNPIPEGEGKLVTIKRIINHAEYNDKTLLHDIALIEIEPIKFEDDKIQPACLPTDTSNLYENLPSIVTGWGNLKSNGTQPKVLHEVGLTTISNTVCKQTYSDKIKDTMLCAYTEGKDSCQGDSGGPLVNVNEGKATLIGVVSWGVKCAIYPGVYTRVTSYLKWINDQTGGLTCNN